MATSKRIAIAGGIVLAGLCIALPFRHRGFATREPVHDAAEQLPWQHVDVLPQGAVQSGTSPAISLYIDSGEPAGAPEDAIAPPVRQRHERLAAPPTLSPAYESLFPPFEDGVSSAELQPAERTLRRHVITDGDTLAELARRYLGRSNRAGEIFQANRHLIAHPDLLPLGVEIVIPDSDNGPTDERMLVPVPVQIESPR